MKQAVSAPGAPAPVGPYSQAIISNGFIFLSGQIALDPDTGRVIAGGVAAETGRILENLGSVLQAAGSSISKVVKATVYLQRMEDFAQMNETYARFFPDTPPARTTIQAGALPRGALVEIDLIASLD